MLGNRSGVAWIGLISCMALLFGTTNVKLFGKKNAPEDAQDGVFRTLNVEKYEVRLDLSTSVLGVDIPDDKTFSDRPGQAEAPIAPRLSTTTGFASASMLAFKAKQFDDGLYASVELAAQRGLGKLPGKTVWLGTLANALASEADTAETAGLVVWSAARLGGIPASSPEAKQRAIEEFEHEFLAEELRSKPIGFYTWSSELANIFRQDRMLQTTLKQPTEVAALVRALGSHPESGKAYAAYLSLVERLTNPFKGNDLRPLLNRAQRGESIAPAGHFQLLPASRAYETDLIMALYGDQPIPEGFNLVDEMIRRIRAGTLSIEPKPDSGWYDRQTYALEPLVIPEGMPEAPRLKFSERYRAQMLELFKAILALTRETHIKQLEIPRAGAALPPLVTIAPELSTEPLPSYYLRRAESYRFVHGVLTDALGESALRTMHRLTAEGPVAASLEAELLAMRGLFFGAYALVSRQIGQQPDADPAIGSGDGLEADVRRFQEWMSALANDPDLGTDARMMVPLYYDTGRNKIKVWVFLGWSQKLMNCWYEQQPTVSITRDGKPVAEKDVSIGYRMASYRIDYPVTAEVYVSRILNRDEFRTHCDTHKTQSAILQNLK